MSLPWAPFDRVADLLAPWSLGKTHSPICPVALFPLFGLGRLSGLSSSPWPNCTAPPIHQILPSPSPGHHPGTAPSSFLWQERLLCAPSGGGAPDTTSHWEAARWSCPPSSSTMHILMPSTLYAPVTSDLLLRIRNGKRGDTGAGSRLGPPARFRLRFHGGFGGHGWCHSRP